MGMLRWPREMPKVKAASCSSHFECRDVSIIGLWDNLRGQIMPITYNTKEYGSTYQWWHCTCMQVWRLHRCHIIATSLATWFASARSSCRFRDGVTLVQTVVLYGTCRIPREHRGCSLSFFGARFGHNYAKSWWRLLKTPTPKTIFLGTKTSSDVLRCRMEQLTRIA